MNKATLPATWEQFCEQTGRDPNALPDVSMYDDRDKKHATAGFKLIHMIRHVNGEEVDHLNSDQTKYEIWWLIKEDKSKPSGRGLSYYYFFYDWGTYTYCGPRLCFLDYDVMKWAAKEWLELFEDLIL